MSLRFLAVGFIVVLFSPVIVVGFVAQSLWAVAHLTALSSTPTETALEDIPPHLLNSYLDAGLHCEVPWNVLAAIGKVEHDHGRGGPFWFSPPVPNPWVDVETELEAAGVEDLDSPLLSKNLDTEISATEAAFIADRLGKWMCEQRETIESATPTTGIGVPGGPVEPISTTGRVVTFGSLAEFNTKKGGLAAGDIFTATGPPGTVLSGPFTLERVAGEPGNHVTLTCAEGVRLTSSTGDGSVKIQHSAHTDLINCSIGGDRFGVFYRGNTGSPGAPARIAGNTVTDTQDGHIAVRAAWGDPSTVSAYVDVFNNSISGSPGNSGQSEGVYLGDGSLPGQTDRTHHIRVYGNEIFDLTSDAVDIKPGVTDFQVTDNYIHDLDFHSVPCCPVAAISVLYGIDPVPGGFTNNANGIIANNRIENLNRLRAISVGYGGVLVEGNTGVNTGTDFVRIQTETQYGPPGGGLTDIVIRCNTTSQTITRVPRAGQTMPTIVEEDNGPTPTDCPPSVAPAGGGEPGAALDDLLALYKDDPVWVAEVIETAISYAELPVTTGPDGHPGGSDVDGCPTGPAPKSATVYVEGYWVHTCIAANFGALMELADSRGVNLHGGWGWRDHFRQHELRRINGCPDGWVHGTPEPRMSPSSRCRIPTARPGHSMHERGLAIDFRCAGRPLNTRRSRCFSFLAENAPRFGFQNLPSEPWHWSINGR